MNRKLFTFSLLLGCIVFFAGCGNNQATEEAPPPPVELKPEAGNEEGLECDYTHFNFDSILEKDAPKEKMSLQEANKSFGKQAEIYTKRITKNPPALVEHRPGGWARHRSVFSPLTKISVSEMKEHPGHFLAHYEFVMYDHWGKFYPAKESADKDTAYARTDTVIHRHSAIWLNGQWQVYERFNLDADEQDEPSAEMECDELSYADGAFHVTNYDACREDDSLVCLYTKSHFYLQPIEGKILSLVSKPGTGNLVLHELKTDLDNNEGDFVSIYFTHHFIVWDPATKIQSDYSVQFVFGDSRNIQDYMHLRFSALSDKLYQDYRSSVLEAVRLSSGKIKPVLFEDFVKEAGDPNKVLPMIQKAFSEAGINE